MGDIQAARRTRIQKIAVDAGSDVLVCYSQGSPHGHMDTVWYATGFHPFGAGAAILGNGPPILLVAPAYEAPRARAIAPDCEVHGVADLIPAIAEALRERKGSIGLAGADYLSAAADYALNMSLGRPWTDVTSLIVSGTSSSDEAGIDAARRATHIAEAGYQQMLENVRPGMREFEMVAGLDNAMRELGAEDNFLLMSASQHGTSVNTPGDRMLEEGDLVLAEISPCVDGIFMQICRTAILGEPSDLLTQRYGLLQEAFASGLARCKPGETIGDIVTAINEPLRAAGFGDYCRPPYMRARGHGMGMASSKPALNPDSSEEVIPGMVFVLHPNQYLPDVGYLMCGDPLVIRQDGPELLSQRLAQLDIVEV